MQFTDHNRSSSPRPGSLLRSTIAPALYLSAFSLLSACSGDLKGSSSITDPPPPPPPATVDTSAIELQPATASLPAGAKQSFAVVGHADDGSDFSVPPRQVTWTATGGTVDVEGNYTAGGTPGSYRVIAYWPQADLADTVPVSVAGPPPPPGVTTMTILPSQTSVGTGQVQGFSALGHSAASGDFNIPVRDLTWSTTGGSISNEGRFTAGLNPGTFHVIAVWAQEGIADTATVVVTSSVPGPQACSNEPPGYAAVSDQPWDAVPPTTPLVDAHGWQIVYTQNRVSTVSDPTAPYSPTNVARGLFPKGQAGGTGPFRLQVNFARQATGVYSCIWQLISSNFTNNGNTGTKFGFLLTPYGSGSSALNHYINLTPAIGMGLQSGDGSLNRNLVSRFNLLSNLGAWHRVEWLVEANNPGAADGKARVWVDGTEVLAADDVTFFFPTQSPAFTGLTWNPTYGGGLNPVPYDMFQLIDHWYISIR